LTAPTVWTVPEGHERVRLDKYVATLLTGETRAHIQQLIRAGQILVNGVRTKTGYVVRAGDRLTLQPAPLGNSPFPMPEDIPISVVFEDHDIAVIDKPAGLVCHAGAGIRSGTLVNALLYRMGPLETGDPIRPGIVHRLDKQTSGLLVVAKNARALRSLAQQFKSRAVHKEYVALVHGVPPEAAGVIDSPLGRDPHNRLKMSARARTKRAAVTSYTVLERYGPVALLKVQPETGRTHQIRVHLAGKGHPVVGDLLYGGNRDRALKGALSDLVGKLQRHFLHATRLEFLHPSTGGPLSFVSQLPGELQQVIDVLKRPDGERASAAASLD
jgi:23S rRNA pseudouridine1911/1915/1917 synthase